MQQRDGLANRHAVVNALAQPGYRSHVKLRIETVVVVAPARREDAVAPLPGTQGRGRHMCLFHCRLGIEEWHVGIIFEARRLDMRLPDEHIPSPRIGEVHAAATVLPTVNAKILAWVRSVCPLCATGCRHQTRNQGAWEHTTSVSETKAPLAPPSHVGKR